MSKWEIKTIGDVCTDSQYGYTTRAAPKGEVKFLRTTDISSGPIDWDSVPYCEENPEDLSKYQLKKGDVVISRAGTVGISSLIDNPPKSAFASYLIRYRPKINPDYFYLYLQSPRYWKQVVDGAAGIALQNLNATKISDFEIPVPDSETQIRLAHKLKLYLNKIDSGIAELESAKEKLELYRQSILNAAIRGKLVPQDPKDEPASVLLEKIQKQKEKLIQAKKIKKEKPLSPITDDEIPFELPKSWIWARIETIPALERYSIGIGPFGSNLKVSDYKESGVPLIFVRNIRSRIFDDEKTKFVTHKKAEELSAHSADAGDVLITKMGDPPGDACVYPLGSPKAVITADCIKVKVNDQLIARDFFSNLINSPVVKPQIMDNTKGVAMQKMSLERFKRILIPIPPRKEQNRINTELDVYLKKIEDISRVIEVQLGKALQLRQSILKKAFEGEL